MSRFSFVMMAALALLLISAPSVRALDLTDEQRAMIREAENHLNGITTMTADFVQISPYNQSGASNISVSYGKLYLSRPGKAVWEYTTPTPIKITINDHRIAYYDKELDQVSYTSVEGNIGSILTNKDIRFLDGTFRLKGFKSDSFGFTFILEDIKKTEAENTDDKQEMFTEQVMLTFLYDPFRLHMFKYKDVNGYVTTIEFKNHQYSETFDDDIFTMSDPRIGKDAWERRKE